MNEEDKDIKAKLEARKEKERKDKPLNNLTITYTAFDKLYQYSLCLQKITGIDLECMGYLVTPADRNDGIISDVFYSFEQDISESAGSSFGGNQRTIEEIYANRLKILGFWHSHGIHPLILSDTDKEVIRFLAAQETKNFEREIAKLNFELEEIESQKVITIPFPEDPYNKIKVVYKTESSENPLVTHVAVDKIKYWYTLIINNRQNRPYLAFVHTKEWDTKQKEYKPHKSEKADLDFIEAGQKLDLASIAEEVFNRTLYKGIKVSEISEFRQNYESLKNTLEPIVKVQKNKYEEEQRKLVISNKFKPNGSLDNLVRPAISEQPIEGNVLKQESRSKQVLEQPKEDNSNQLNEWQKKLKESISQLDKINMQHLDKENYIKILEFKTILESYMSSSEGTLESITRNSQPYIELKDKLIKKTKESERIVDEERIKLSVLYEQIRSSTSASGKGSMSRLFFTPIQDLLKSELRLPYILTLGEYIDSLKEMNLRYLFYQNLQNREIDSIKTIEQYIRIIKDELETERMLVEKLITNPQTLAKKLFNQKELDDSQKKLFASYLTILGFDEGIVSETLKVI